MDKAPDAFRIISEVADDLDVPQHVLRFWESRFTQIKPMKRGGGRRYYRPDDVDLLRGIRHLLYSEGYTIRGVQRILREHGARFVQAVWQEGAPQPPRGPAGDSGEEQAARANRGLLGLLPGFRKLEGEPRTEGVEAQVAETAAAVTAGATAQQPPRGNGSAAAALGREQLRAMQSILDDLIECRRLIDAAAE